MLKHPLDWKCGEVADWLLQEIPRKASRIIPEIRKRRFDGGLLWYSKRSDFVEMGFCGEDVESICDALRVLKFKSDQEEILLCMGLQDESFSESDPCLHDAFEVQRLEWDLLKTEISDSRCCLRICEVDLQRVNNIISDSELSLRLQSEEANVSTLLLERKFEQERLDLLFARRVSEQLARGQDTQNLCGDIVPPIDDDIVQAEQITERLSKLFLESKETQASMIEESGRTSPVSVNSENSRAGWEIDENSIHIEKENCEESNQSPAKAGRKPVNDSASAHESRFETVIPTRKAQCSICFEQAPVVQLACEHSMCKICLRKLYAEAITDRTLLPVRCCKVPLDAELAAALLPPDMLITLVRKTKEAQAQNFVYCPTPACSAFIDLDSATTAAQGRRLECAACSTAICVACKAAWHEGVSCDESREARDADGVARLARDNGWMRCGRCAVYVMLAHGCNHMTCVCGHHFCYACG